MVLKPITLLFTFVLALPLVTVVFVQDAPGQNQAAKKGSWEGNVVRSNPDKSTFTVRQMGTNVEETIHYDGATVGSARSTAARRSTPSTRLRSRITIG